MLADQGMICWHMKSDSSNISDSSNSSENEEKKKRKNIWDDK